MPLDHFQDMSKWHPLVPQDPSPRDPRHLVHPLCFSDALQLATFHEDAQPCTSQQYSDESGDRYASSTGYSHSPPRSPRVKRPSSRNADAFDYTSAGPQQDPSTEAAVLDPVGREGRKPLHIDQRQNSHLLFDSPKSIETPDQHRDNYTRNIFSREDVRERAASNVYGLRRLRASPRWAEESADMSEASMSEGEVLICNNLLRSTLCNAKPSPQ